MNIPIIFEDDDLVVIDKPAGRVVNRADSVKEETIQDWAEEKLGIRNQESGIRNDDFYGRAGIVHRLDKETSGLLIIAKNPTSFTHLQTQFKERQVHKKYLTLVHGIIESKTGEIRASVGRLPWNKERFGVLPGGRESVTLFKVISYYQNKWDKYSLLTVSPQTGRTHQIRIHLKYLGYPCVSDSFYTGRKRVRLDKQFCPRLFLQAVSIKFFHPKNGKTIDLSIGLADDLKQVIDNLLEFNC